MFPDKLQLSALTELSTADAWEWEAFDLDRLVSSCCQIQTLSLYCSEGLQLIPLLQLTALAELRLRGATDDSTVASLVQLSALPGLQELFIMDPCCFTDDDAVRSLTALTQLTRLALSDSDDVFSTDMQEQLQQWFDQEELDEPDEMFYIIDDMVGTVFLGVMSHNLTCYFNLFLCYCHCHSLCYCRSDLLQTAAGVQVHACFGLPWLTHAQAFPLPSAHSRCVVSYIVLVLASPCITHSPLCSSSLALILACSLLACCKQASF